MKEFGLLLIGIGIGGMFVAQQNIVSVDKTGYETVAHYKLYDRVYTPYELDMLCK